MGGDLLQSFPKSCRRTLYKLTIVFLLDKEEFTVTKMTVSICESMIKDVIHESFTRPKIPEFPFKMLR